MKIYFRNGIIIFAAAIALFIIFNLVYRDDTMDSTTAGYATVLDPMVIHQNADEKSRTVKDGDLDVTIANGDSLTILSSKGDWYKISFESDGKTYEGYVPKVYVSTISASKTVKITGKLNKDCYINERPFFFSDPVKDGESPLVVEEGTSVSIGSVAFTSGEKWYLVSFSHNGNPYQGFARAADVEVNYFSGIQVQVRTKGNTVLLKKPGTVVPVSVDGQMAAFSDGALLIATNIVEKDGIQYLRVEGKQGSQTAIGYIPDNMLTFKSIETYEYSSDTEADYETEKYEDILPVAEPVKPAQVVQLVDNSGNITDSSGNVTKAVIIPDNKFTKDLKNQGFPDSYISILLDLHRQFPYWRFEAMDTGLSWNDVISHESRVGLNLITNAKAPDWKSQAPGAYDASTGRYIPYDGSSWVTASLKCVEFYMDPRNFLNAANIFMFENLSYQKETQTEAGVENILVGTPMAHKSYTYKDSDGKKHRTTYAKTFMEAAEITGVSPYHLASRVKQEVIRSSTQFSGSADGHNGYYNFYNIGASNSTVPGGAVANGLRYAAGSGSYMRPWNNIHSAIIGGAMFIGQNYINIGQNTLYLQKFNVTEKATYNHQYMGGIEAPAAESLKTALAYGANMRNMTILFTIPVYNNLPTEICPAPAGDRPAGQGYVYTYTPVQSQPTQSPEKAPAPARHNRHNNDNDNEETTDTHESTDINNHDSSGSKGDENAEQNGESGTATGSSIEGE
ncbi:MAG: hypothetical protein VZR00_02665 [Lachnospiraceae bacterium]|nr:hypothetical protein [Lachnospiraceae bacterium]MEE3460779.1 hypothetical protein [Lachnospiraceae bacterium]